MKRTLFPVITVFLTLSLLFLSSCRSRNEIEDPVLILRLSSENTESDEQWAATFKAIRDNPGCCDEVWFSTGLGVRPLSWHRDNAERMARASAQLRELGIKGSVQIQMTIGHGDDFGVGKEDHFSEKHWKGWTGATGVEDRFCNCPSQPDFLRYMEQVARIYAGTVRPWSLWIDDDLRFVNHLPATDHDRLGCWCDDCIAAFNSATGGSWTRETLDAAMSSDEALAASWRSFSTGTLAHLADVIGRAVHDVSPETIPALQHTYAKQYADYISEVLTTLYEASGIPVRYRPGGGDYYDWDDPLGQICKSMEAADFRRVMGDPDYVAAWVPEIESWPRVYGGRTAQGVLVEAFTAIAYGMDGVSYFTISSGVEDDGLYSRYMLHPISLGSDVLHEYRDANKGTVSVGYELTGDRWQQLEAARLGLPVAKGMSVTIGAPDAADVNIDPKNHTSRDVQALRDAVDMKYPSPVLCCSPYFGLMIPRTDTDGVIRTIGLLNTRIDSQYDIKLRINGLPEHVDAVIWHEMKKEPVKLSVIRENGSAYVTVPEIGAWNGGFVDVR